MPFESTYCKNFNRTLRYAFLYTFLGWLFLITKPSFMGGWSWEDKVIALVTVSGGTATVAVLVHTLLSLISIVNKRLVRLNEILNITTPSLLAAIISLMLLDNFSYTVFGWGIINSGREWAVLYWIFIFIFFYWHINREQTFFSKKTNYIPIIIFFASISTTLYLYTTTASYQAPKITESSPPSSLPNIIFFASDGVNADHLSAYGYYRETSPNLDKRLKKSLFIENAYTNSSWTTGSLTSMMTGKYPATTKVMYPPYILSGKDAYQNFPRILREIGYRSQQETVRYYADGPDLNWKGSFMYANGRRVTSNIFNGFPLGLQKSIFLGGRMLSRLFDRIGKIFFIRKMVDRYAAVTSGVDSSVYAVTDTTRMNRALDFMTKKEHPFFIQIHLMGTHCCQFHPKKKIFHTDDIKNNKAKTIALYDDTILRSDYWFGKMIQTLKERSLLKHTIIIYSSDHNMGWSFKERVPLIIFFPKGNPSGSMKSVVQLVDVAPTILDYLGVPIPSWMEGSSLLDDDFSSNTPIYSVYRLDRTHFKGSKHEILAKISNMGPPTFGLKKAGLVICNRWFTLDIITGKIKAGQSNQKTNSCTQKEIPSKAHAADMIRSHLESRGFSLSKTKD